MRVVGVMNGKGGVGKTMIAINVAAAAATERNEKVLLLDADPQGSCMRWAELRSETKKPVIRPAKLAELQDILRGAAEAGFDLCVIDTAGKDTTELRLAIPIMDVILVPTQPSPLDAYETIKIRRIIQSLGVPAPIVVTRVQREKSPRIQEVVNFWSGHGDEVPVAIPERVAFVDAFSLGQGIVEYLPDHPAANAIRALYRHIYFIYAAKDHYDQAPAKYSV
ncbi:MAG: AAA family ATPase [Alphaproteobacteria bacterium]|nr:AAA family ATPase [Alphaproteobacteria bacterium]